MLTTTTDSEERITTAHRAKLAYVYIRQSSAGQVRQHQESTQLQYRLVGRAASLGWPHDRIEVIDDDLGKSGASAAPDDADNAVRFRRGWFLGDGTGAGKGRQVAGIILDNWLKGRRRALWISKSDKLMRMRSAIGRRSAWNACW